MRQWEETVIDLSDDEEEIKMGCSDAKGEFVLCLSAREGCPDILFSQ